jgi:phosphate starvation-inducible PhoH-like protein
MAKRKQPATQADQEEHIPAIGNSKLSLNESQRAFMAIMDEKPIGIATGVPGSGKSFACLAWARQAIRRKQVDRIVIIRSPLEMGRSRMGYLPGESDSKILPYVQSNLEIAKKLGIPSEFMTMMPLGYILGMTFERSAIICEEFEIMTIPELRAVVSRMGIGSSLMLCGDPEQDTRNSCGIEPFINAVQHLDCVGIRHFTEADNMRHPAIMPMMTALRGL